MPLLAWVITASSLWPAVAPQVVGHGRRRGGPHYALGSGPAYPQVHGAKGRALPVGDRARRGFDANGE